MRNKSINWFALAVSIGVAELTGLVSALLGGNSSAYYAQLVRPPLSPPSWLFPVAWTLLYVLLGVAAYRVYRAEPSAGRRRALGLYALQLGVNFLWNPAFFGLHNPALGLAVILVLDLFVVLTIARFARVDRCAAWLLAPYLLWLLYATYLNIGIVLLNG
ncbi:MAG: TspO/MBR family protein [Christensenellales bacterium]|jgi:benzodiazapine receptor